MALLDPPSDDLTDAELIARTRAGDQSGFAMLWHRFEGTARRFAARLAPMDDVDDVVQEAFTQIYQAVTNGHGPRDLFRPYMYQAVRTSAYRRSRLNPPTDSDDLLVAVAAGERTDKIVDSDTIVSAFRTLQPRWREVLWLQEVEDLSSTEIAEILGIAPNAVAALAFRAREGLRQAWLQAQLHTAPAPETCRWSAERIGENARGRLSPVAKSKFDAHVVDCAFCAPLVAEATDLAQNLRGLLVPALVPVFLGLRAGELGPALVDGMPATHLHDGFWLGSEHTTRHPGWWHLRRLLPALLSVVVLIVLAALAVSGLQPDDETSPQPSRGLPTSVQPSPDPSRGTADTPTVDPTSTSPEVPAESSQASEDSTPVIEPPVQPGAGPAPRKVFVSAAEAGQSGAELREGSGLVNSAVGSASVPEGVPPIQQPSDSVTTRTNASVGLDLTKTATLLDADLDGRASEGETIEYSFSLTNTGVTTLSEVAVDDPRAGAVTCARTVLAPGASTTCVADAPYVVTLDDVRSGAVVNSATGRGMSSAGGAALVSSVAAVSVPTAAVVRSGLDDLVQTGAMVTAAFLGAVVLTSAGTLLRASLGRRRVPPEDDHA